LGPSEARVKPNIRGDAVRPPQGDPVKGFGDHPRLTSGQAASAESPARRESLAGAVEIAVRGARVMGCLESAQARRCAGADRLNAPS